MYKGYSKDGYYKLELRYNYLNRQLWLRLKNDYFGNGTYYYEETHPYGVATFIKMLN